MKKRRGAKEFKTFAELAAKVRFPNLPENDRLYRINGRKSIENYLGVHIFYNGSLICPEDILITQYILSRIEDFKQGEYGYSNSLKNRYERIVADMGLVEVSENKALLGDSNPDGYKELAAEIRKDILPEIEKNLWRNNALRQFLTIIHSNCSRFKKNNKRSH